MTSAIASRPSVPVRLRLNIRAFCLQQMQGLWGSARETAVRTAARIMQFSRLAWFSPAIKACRAGLTSTYYKAFAPRIGIAWSPGGTEGLLAKLTGGPGKSSVRRGYGIFYNPIEQLVMEQFSAEPPFGGSAFISNPLFNRPLRFRAAARHPTLSGESSTRLRKHPAQS